MPRNTALEPIARRHLRNVRRPLARSTVPGIQKTNVRPTAEGIRTPSPQAHPTGYPIYRLEWQGLGSLQRRLRGCFAGVRAEVPPFEHADLLALELHLMQRAAGMPLETPAVRP